MAKKTKMSPGPTQPYPKAATRQVKALQANGPPHINVHKKGKK
jgi:hypothetical protein